MTRELESLGGAVRVITPRVARGAYSEGTVQQLRGSGDPPTQVSHYARRVFARVDPRRWSARARYEREVLSLLQVRPAECVVISNDPELASLLFADGHRVLLWLHNYLQGSEVAALRRVPHAIRMIAVSDSVRRWTVDTCGVDAGRVVTIYNGVNRSVFYPLGTRGASQAPIRIIAPGRLDPNKGQLLAARAVEEVKRRGVHDIEFAVLGATQTFGHRKEVVSAYEAELTRAVHEAGGTMVGRVAADKVGEWLREADIALVLPLVPEPFGLAALEALASGCATVVVAAGGLAEVVGDAALLVEPIVAGAADALERLLRDPALLEQMKRRGITRAAQFDWYDSALRLNELACGQNPKAS
jgi:glycosyltransferase involved in cell wall biosynthesis